MTRRQRHAAAFSLTELLVVISVFCLLAAMCLPTFARMVAIARRVHCAENLRSVATAYEARAAVAASGDLPPLEARGWVTGIAPFLGGNLDTLACPEDESRRLFVPDVKMFVWGSGGAARSDYFINLTTCYPYWLEGPCADVRPPPGIWKIAEAHLHTGGYYGEAFGLAGLAGGRNNTDVLPIYTPGPDPNVYWYVLETARYGEDLHAGGDLDYDDIVVRVTENRAARRIEIEPIRIWEGQVYNLVGPDGTWWPSGTSDPQANRDQSVGSPGTMGPYFFPMGRTSYGMSLYAQAIPHGLRKVLALDYRDQVVEVGPDAQIGAGWDNLGAPRHLGKCNVLFGDGSVEAIEPDTIDPGLDANDAMYWDPGR